MENAPTDSKTPNIHFQNPFQSSLPFNRLQTILLNQCSAIQSNAFINLGNENISEFMKKSGCFTPQQIAIISNQPEMAKLVEFYRSILQIPKQPFEQIYPVNASYFNPFPHPMPMQFQMPFMQPTPMETKEVNISTEENLSKPKNKFLKRHYEEMNQGLKASNVKNEPDISQDVEAPFGRSKCGKPLKRPAFVPSYMDNFKGPYLCVVCEHDASGLHYKALTCEGCKGFFRRTVQQNLTYECKFLKNCDVSRRVKKDVCRSCRWDKCLKTGMAQNSVLNEDERKMKNDLIRLNKLKRATSASMSLKNSGSQKSINMENSYNDSIKSEPTDESSKDETINHESTGSLEISKWIKSLVSSFQNSEIIKQHTTLITDYFIKKIFYLVQNLPDFEKLTNNQKICLIQNRNLYCLIILIAFTYSDSKETFNFNNVHILYKPFVETIRNKKIQDFVNFASKIEQFGLSQSEKSIIFVLVLLYDHQTISVSSSVIEELEITYLEALNYTTSSNIRRSKILLMVFPALTKLVNDFLIEENYQVTLHSNFIGQLQQLIDHSSNELFCSFESELQPLSLKVKENI